MAQRQEAEIRAFLDGPPREYIRNSANAPTPRELSPIANLHLLPSLRAVVTESMRHIMEGQISESGRQGVVIEDPDTGKMLHMWDNDVIGQSDGTVASFGPAETGLFIEPVTLSAPVILTPDNIARRRLLSAGELIILPRDPESIFPRTKVLLGQDLQNRFSLFGLASQIARSKPLDRTGH